MDPNAEEAKKELAAVLASPAFRTSPRLGSLLEYLFANQKTGLLKETVIANEFFGRASDYDPKADSLVRTEIRRLRLKLADYYMNEGAGAVTAGRLEIPKGAYEVVWRPAPTAAPSPAAEPIPRVASSRLRILIPVIALFLIALAVGFAWKSDSSRNPPRSVAVLPFGGAASGPTESIADDLALRLTRSKQLRVTAANSTAGFRGRTESADSIGKRLAVDGIIDGSVESTAAGDVSIEARLIDSRTGRKLWSGKVNGAGKNLAQLEDELASGILSALGLPATPAPYHPKSEALDLYISGLQRMSKPGGPDIERALGLFEQAAQIDPGFAAPQASAAHIYLVAANNGLMDPSIALPKAETALSKALAADPDSSDAHASLGELHYQRWAWREARAEYAKAIELNPSSYAAYKSLANLLTILGRFDEAERELRHAIELNPLWYGPQVTLAELYYYAKKYDQSFEVAEKIGQRFPGESGMLFMAKARRRQGRKEEAARYLSEVPAGRAPPLFEAYKAVYSGDTARAIELMRAIDRKKEYYPAWNRAQLAMELGDREQAIALLEKSLAAGEPDLCSLNVEPLFDPIRDDPRCQQILHRLNLK